MYNWISIKKTQRQNEVFVERANRYIVSDDLQVMLLCTATSFSLLSKCGIMDGNAIEERAFNLGKDEVLDLLMNSLVSRTPLTETLLKHKPVPIELNNVISYQRKSAKERTNQEQGIYVKLFVSKSKKMICYTEAKKDFIDLLFSFLTVPLGHIVKQEYDYGSLKGCTDQLYKSVNDFGEQGFTSNDHKEMLVNPRVAPGFSYGNYLLGIEEASLPSCHYYSGDLISEPYFNELKNKEESIPLTLKYSRSHDKEGESRDGFLKGMNLFTVTDNLIIKPVSPMLGLPILNELKVPFNDIEERTVRVKKEEALNLLMSSFVSESALTNTFI
ncbi:uncharacterized protein LOC133791192 [Humulus lupulus]|uniref:uncharacterized protein LOC133791192 n=1 Tax=Humulus lupulus TaxID=3486 RepID=UPI002B4146ED|nr:uncharacterized protein LOC133791192 [Humulus lupulus]